MPYVAPEVSLCVQVYTSRRTDDQLGGPAGQGYAAEPVDIWGMGVVLYTLLVGSKLLSIAFKREC